MLLKVLVSSLLLTSFLAAAFPDNRIVNGTNAAEGEYPYIVSIRYGVSHSCGGSIIDSLHILTAAHCIYGMDPTRLSIQYGLTKITSDHINVINVVKGVYNENYDPSRGYLNDVSVLKLQTEIPLDALSVPTLLPRQGDATPEDQNAVLIGWGLPYSGGNVVPDLQKVQIKVFNNEDCRKAHGAKFDERVHICAGVPEGGKGQCSGDSGGPLTVNGVQVGVVSWSVKPCTVKGYPGVFAKVAAQIDWIKKTVSEM